jgi:hypothetical protein
MRSIVQKGNAAISILLSIVLGGGVLAAWLTHLYVCFNASKWGFLIAGALFFPVGIIHGFGLWFGFW